MVMGFFWILINRWRGLGEQEEGVDAKTGTVLVKVDPRYFRPAEVEYVPRLSLNALRPSLSPSPPPSPLFLLPPSPSPSPPPTPPSPTPSLLLGNPSKAEQKLGWRRRIDFDTLVKEMVEADFKASKSLVEDQN